MQTELKWKHIAYCCTDSKTHAQYHYHDTFEILLLISGTNNCFIKDRTYLLRNADLLFVDKTVLHKAQYLTDSYKRVYINYADDFLDPAIIELSKPLFEQKVYTPSDPVLIRGLFHGIEQEMKKEDSMAWHLVKSYLTQLLAYCIRNPSVYTIESNTNPALQRLIQYMNKNFSQKITLSTAAGMLHMSEGHLSRLFLSDTGFHFHEYLNILRMKKACSLLQNSRLSIQEVSQQCGFGDSNYFSQAFKVFIGMPPLRYRKQFL